MKQNSSMMEKRELEPRGKYSSGRRGTGEAFECESYGNFQGKWGCGKVWGAASEAMVNTL